MKTNKKAISLIVLVITIIVLAILAATVIISLSNTNIIEQARVAAFKNDMASYKEAAELYVASEMARNQTGDSSGINLEADDTNYSSVFGEVPDKYAGKLSIVGGKLVFETEVQSEIEVLEKMGIASNIEAEDDTLAPGLYQTGTTILLKTWDELIATGGLTVTNGVLYAETTYVEEIGMEFCIADIYGDLVIPSTVTRIVGPFAEGDLTNVIIPNSVTEIESYTFYYSNLSGRLVIPNSVVSIREFAFAGCYGLNSVVIPDSVTSIEMAAFQYCDGITDVYYTGTAQEWSNINIDYADNDCLENATIHYEYVIE
ncbi:MAG: leucine-rich repeat protein [Clostridia bacterium]|nr:leucine-rich repeat protein [Clostridia bacterium]